MEIEQALISLYYSVTEILARKELVMNINAQIDKMSTVEKLRTMEYLWADLRQASNSIPSSAWHHDVLQQREKDLEDGKDCFTDWEQAKKDIRNSIK